jgi:hypothetical protein
MPARMQRIWHALTALGANTAPAVGWLFEDWSSGTLLAVYWFENVFGAVLVGARILLHRRLRPLAGRYRYEAPSPQQGRRTTFLANFLPISLIFSAAHGVLLGFLVLVLTNNGKGDLIGIDPGALLTGGAIVALFLVGDFLVDALTIKSRPFAWIEARAERSFARILVVHLVIILGMFAVAFTGADRAFFAVFIVLKTLNDLNAVVPQWQPKDPPRWLAKIMNAIPPARPGQSFEEFWVADQAREAARRTKNERPHTP